LGCLIFSALIHHSFLSSHTFLQSSSYHKNFMQLNQTIETWEIVSYVIEFKFLKNFD
jgi:hypothetical protein